MGIERVGVKFWRNGWSNEGGLERIIGPNVFLGAGCRIEHSIIRDSILEDEAQATDIILDSSLVGRRAVLRRRAGVINAGDNFEVTL